MKIFVGVDAGGSKTEVIVGDSRGTILGHGLAGAGNPLSVGTVRTVENIQSAVRNAISQIENPQIEAIYIGMAGGKPAMRKEITKRLHLTSDFRQTKIVADHDLRTALYSGLPEGDGIVLIVGTGSCAFCEGPNGEEIEVSGWDHWLGETGGYELGIKAIIAATRNHDGRGPKTILEEMIADELKLNRFEDISIIIKSPTIDSPKIASLSPLVVKAAKLGDKVAKKIITEMIDEMNSSIHAAAVRSQKKGLLKVVLVGGMFNTDIDLVGRLRRRMHRWNENVQLIRPSEKPSVTAYRFARKI